MTHSRGEAQAAFLGETRHMLWCDLVAQIGADMDLATGRAIDCLREMASRSVDREQLSALRLHLEGARRTAHSARQIARVAEGAARGDSERLCMAESMRAVLSEREPEIKRHGIAIDHSLPVSHVLADRAAVGLLLRAIVSWTLEHADGAAQLRLDRSAHGGGGTLACRFRRKAFVRPRSRFGGAATSGATWQLLWHLAQALGWELRGGDDAGQDGPTSWLLLAYPLVQAPTARSAVEAVELTAPAPLSSDHNAAVLVVGSEACMQAQIADSVAGFGIELVCIASAQEAAQRCSRLAPRIVVGERQMVEEVRGRLGNATLARYTTFIEVSDEGGAFEFDAAATGHVAHVGRDALAAALPIALLIGMSHPPGGLPL